MSWLSIFKFVYQPVLKEITKFVMAFTEEMAIVLVNHQLFGLIGPLVYLTGAIGGQVLVTLAVDQQE